MKHKFLLIFFLISAFFACSPESEEVQPPIVEPPVETLKSASPYPFGAAISMSKIRNSEPYINTVKSEFNSITAENAMKMTGFAPSGKDNYHWTDADYLVNFAQENDMRVHGHALVWHRSVPNWVNNYSGTKEDWKLLLKNYITTVVSRYKGQIQSWDVVNEALLDNGTPRESVWLTKIGWEYIALAFQYAHEADPDAVLFYNDYGQEYSNVKLAAINDTVKNMVARGVPIHGIGLQMHTNINHSADRMVNAINKTVETGLVVHVSELDIALNPNSNTDYVMTESDLEAQRIRYRSVAAAMCLIPDNQNWGITTWGVSDNDSWLTPNPDYPLLFDIEFKEKSCYYGVLQGFTVKQ